MIYIKYSPVKWNEYAAQDEGVLSDTVIVFVDDNTVAIDGENYEFDPSLITYSDVDKLSNGVIPDAYRKDAVLYLTVRRFYTRYVS